MPIAPTPPSSPPRRRTYSIDRATLLLSSPFQQFLALRPDCSLGLAALPSLSFRELLTLEKIARSIEIRLIPLFRFAPSPRRPRFNFGHLFVRSCVVFMDADAITLFDYCGGGVGGGKVKDFL